MEKQATDQRGLVDREREALSIAFDHLAMDITPNDKKEAAKKLGLNERTVYRYCSGRAEEIRDIDRGREIFNCLRAAAIKRKNYLERLNAA